MNSNGCYLTIESVRKTSAQSFAEFIAKSLYDWVEKDCKGDFSHLENDGADHILFLISEYEEGARAK